MGAIGSISCGYLVKVIGRIPLFLFAAILSAILILTMQFFWIPDPAQSEIFYIMAGLIGLCNAIFNTQVNCMFFGFLKYHITCLLYLNIF